MKTSRKTAFGLTMGLVIALGLAGTRSDAISKPSQIVVSALPAAGLTVAQAALPVIRIDRTQDPQRLPPGVYETSPSKGIIKSPPHHSDERSVVVMGAGKPSAPPVLEPALRLTPRPRNASGQN